MNLENNPYILVMPDKKLITVPDIEYAKAYVNRYYERRLDDYTDREEFREFDIKDPETRNNIFIQIGEDEGSPKLYGAAAFIAAIRKSDFFEDEKEEIIKSVLEDGKIIDSSKYDLDVIFVEIEPKELLNNK